MFKPIRIRDRKAPRFRWSAGRYTVLNQDLFKAYKKDVENPIEDFSLFKDIIEEFNNEVKAEVIKNRDGVKLPALMGVMGICSYKTSNSSRRPPVNWEATEQNGVKLKEFNLHTGGLSCKIVYSCYGAKYKFRNWGLWKFKGNRDFTTKVSKAFELNYNFYKRMDNKSQVSKIFRDDYITKMYRPDDYIRTHLQREGDEQNDQCGFENN